MNKKMNLMLSALLLAVVCFAQGDFEWERKIDNVKGKVSLLTNGETWVLVPADNPNGRYISQQLPEEYKKDGLAVVFSGWVGKIPPHVRMMGTPLKLTKISVSRADKKKFKLKKSCYSFK
ncbi:MAG: hypothetical protein IPH78_01065 [Bacteroidetes bacterium]|nr:hypothetical protein [Bacteroidota bacterium]MBK8660075.1 hypothetical protein [Bacteroidota bacterium]